MSDSDASDFSEGGWIHWFCNLDDHSFFCKVDIDYIKDSFNLYGLKKLFSHYNEALQMILDPESPEDEDLEDHRFLDIYQEAMDLYGLIHARFIVSPKGVSMMKDKFLKGDFGVCPRVLCPNQNVLPVGMSETLRHSRVKVFCPRCEDVYTPKKKCSNVDGAYFGCSFPSFLLQSNPDLTPPAPPALYVPRVYGFKVFGKRGSRFADQENRDKKMVSYFGEERQQPNPDAKIIQTLRDD